MTLDKYFDDGGRGSLAELVEKIFGVRLTPFQSHAIKLVEETNRNILVIAPTGAGKTLIGYAALLKHGRGFYLAPLIAIMNEKFVELHNALKPLGYTVVVTNRDYRIPLSRLLSANIKIMSPYKFIMYWRILDPRKHGEVIVVDEIHKLHRDPMFEAAITLARMKGFRIVGLSATVSDEDAKSMGEWLDAEVVKESKRPVELKYVPATFSVTPGGSYVARRSLLYKRSDSDSGFPVVERGEVFRHRVDIAATIAARLYVASGRPVIVWAPTRAWVETIARKIADMLPEKPEFVELAKRLPVTGAHSILRYTVRHGVWIHHGGLPYTVRQFVEENYRKHGGIIVTAYTLSHGVNLPGTFLVFATLRDFRGDVLDASTFHQISGRAGRPGYDEVGFVIPVVVGDSELELLNKFLSVKASRIEPALLSDPFTVVKLSLPVYASGGWRAVREVLRTSYSFMKNPSTDIEKLLELVRDAVEFYRSRGREGVVAMSIGLHPLEYEAIEKAIRSSGYRDAIEKVLEIACVINNVDPARVYEDIVRYGYLAIWIGNPLARSVADTMQTILEAGAYWAGIVYGWKSSEREKLITLAKRFAYAGNERVEPLAKEVRIDKLRRMIKAVPQIVEGAAPEEAVALTVTALKEAFLFARRVYRSKMTRLAKLTYYAICGAEPDSSTLRKIVDEVVKELKKMYRDLEVV